VQPDQVQVSRGHVHEPSTAMPMHRAHQTMRFRLCGVSRCEPCALSTSCVRKRTPHPCAIAHARCDAARALREVRDVTAFAGCRRIWRALCHLHGQVHMRGGSVSQNASNKHSESSQRTRSSRAILRESGGGDVGSRSCPCHPSSSRRCRGCLGLRSRGSVRALTGASAGCASVGLRHARCRESKVARRTRHDRRRHPPPRGSGAVSDWERPDEQDHPAW